MTAPREDYCPACGSNELLPYAVIVGAAETYGYQCLSCAVTWPVLTSGTLPENLAPPWGVTGPAA
jgi:transposase-like protein